MFNINYSSQSKKFLKKSEKVLTKRLLAKIQELTNTPVLHDSKILEGSKELLYRVRVGSYRILYEIDYKQNTIGIVKLDKRDKVY